MQTELNEMTEAEFLAHCKRLTAGFRAKHPAHAAANAWVDEKAQAIDGPACDKLVMGYIALTEILDGVLPAEFEDRAYVMLLRIMAALLETGSAARARKGRSAKAGRLFVELVMALNIYLRERHLEPRISKKFADRIAADVEQIIGRKVSVGTLVCALKACHGQTLARAPH